MILKYKNIIALTTDPLDSLRGYSLVFFRLFNYISENYLDINVYLFSNQGNCTKVVENKNFKNILIEESLPLFKKTFKLFIFFTSEAKKYDKKDSVVIVNYEIPELMSALVLKYIYGFNVFAIVQDLRIRDKNISCILINLFRYLLLFLVKKLFFVNEYTLESVWWVGKRNKYLIGNPIF